MAGQEYLIRGSTFSVKHKTRKIMKKIEQKIKTPRGTFNIHTEFKDTDEAYKHGWNHHFTHEGIMIMNKDNRCGAIVKSQTGA